MGIKKTGGATLGLLFLAGCSGMLETKGTAYNVEASESYVKESIAYATSRLKDPESARFSGIFTTKSSGSEVINVCGLVNAKNSYGGYTGNKSFVATPASAYFEVTVVRSGDYEGMIANNRILQACKMREGERPRFLPEYKQ